MRPLEALRTSLALASALVFAAPAALARPAEGGSKPLATTEQVLQDRARLERAKRDYEDARRQEAREIRARARRDEMALRKGGVIESGPTAAEQRRLEAEARERAAAQRQRQDAIRAAERNLREAEREYQAALEKAKKK